MIPIICVVTLVFFSILKLSGVLLLSWWWSLFPILGLLGCIIIVVYFNKVLTGKWL